MYSIETPRTFGLRHDTTTLGVLRRCATALICMAGAVLLFLSIGTLLGIGSGGYGGAGCTGKQHVYHRSALAPTAPCALSSDVVATPSPVPGEVPATPVVTFAPAMTPAFVSAEVPDPKLATSQGRLDHLKNNSRWWVLGFDVLALLVFGAGALVFTLIPRGFTWVRWGGTRVAWSPDLTPVLAPRSGVWFAWFWLTAAAVGESVRLTSLSEKLFDDGFVLAVASGVIASWLLLTALSGILNALIMVVGEVRTSFR